MPDETKDLAQIIRFQQSLLMLVSRDTTEQSRSNGSAVEQNKQLDDWARKIQASSG